MTLSFHLNGPLPAGVTLSRDPVSGEVIVHVDPVVAHDLQGSKAKLATLRAEVAGGFKAERAAMTDTLMKVTLALAGLIEAYDWVMSPDSGLAGSGLTDEGRSRLRLFFLTSASAARSVLNDARLVPVDWDEVVGGRKVEAVEGGDERNIWATMSGEVQKFVQGPEGASFVRLIDQFAKEAPDDTFGEPMDRLYDLFEALAVTAGAARALVETDPARKDMGLVVYRGVVAMALAASRQLVLRQLALVPEPEPAKSDPYIRCHDCVAKARCEAERKCARS